MNNLIDTKILQFITHGATVEQTVRQVEEVVAGGCRWVQLRMKKFSDHDIERVIERAKPICRAAGAICIIDDRVDMAAKHGLDGVHLGPDDMPVNEARNILGENAIIGVTANTIEQIIELAQQPMSYFGLGPMRFTDTKEHLSPLIGLAGYHNLVEAMRETGVTKPAVAVGGITLNDVYDLLDTGLWGVAVSGAIAKSTDMQAATRQFIQITDNFNR